MLDKMNPFKKKSEKSELDRVLDESFRNAGPLGALAKPLIKGVASMVGDAMKETAADMDDLTDQTVRAIRMNQQVHRFASAIARVEARGLLTACRSLLAACRSPPATHRTPFTAPCPLPVGVRHSG